MVVALGSAGQRGAGHMPERTKPGSTSEYFAHVCEVQIHHARMKQQMATLSQLGVAE